MTQDQNNPDCHELRVLATNGRVFRLKIAEIHAFLLGKRFFATLAVFCSLLAVVDPLIFQNEVLLPWRIVFWNANGLFVTAVWYLLFLSFARLIRVLNLGIAIPSALMIGLAVTALLHFNYWLAGIILEMPELWKGRLYWDILRYTAVAVIFETMIAMFVLPRVLFALRRARAVQGEADAQTALEGAAEADIEAVSETCELLDIAGKQIRLAQVLYLKSAEHYVEVVFHDVTELVRASLRELVDTLPPCHGVQPHRSYWVNKDAIVGMNRAKGAQFLVMRNGDEVPVSRHRRGEVTTWLEAHVTKKGRA